MDLLQRVAGKTSSAPRTEVLRCVPLADGLVSLLQHPPNYNSVAYLGESPNSSDPAFGGHAAGDLGGGGGGLPP